MKLRIFADQRNLYFPLRMLQVFYHLIPLCQIRFRARQVQALAGHLCQVFPLHRKRGLIQVFHIQVLQHMAVRNVAEQGNFILQALVQLML